MTDRERKKQALVKSRPIVLYLFLIAMGLVLSVTLSGCGKKPGSVDPPPDVTEDHFPHLYPDPATDPKP